MPTEYLKDAPPRVFDVHVHFGPRPDADPSLPKHFQREMLAYACRRLNIRKVALLGRRGEDDWQSTLDAQEAHPDLFIPLAQVFLDEDDADQISRLHERGFRGLKITGPNKNYDDESYYPVYERCEELGCRSCSTPASVAARSITSSSTRETPTWPSARLPRWRSAAGAATRGAARMQPIYLDTLGVAFPHLRIIGAHLGYGLYDSAAAVARWRRNVTFDISGGAVVRRHIIDRQMIYKEILPEKLVWGSDCDVTHMSRELTSWMDAFNAMGMSADDQDKIFYRNAAHIFGVE